MIWYVFLDDILILRKELALVNFPPETWEANPCQIELPFTEYTKWDPLVCQLSRGRICSQLVAFYEKILNLQTIFKRVHNTNYTNRSKYYNIIPLKQLKAHFVFSMML